jgi:putative heme-binding domain-containing protein
MLIDRLLMAHPRPPESLRTLLHSLAAVVGARQDPAEVAAVLATLKRLDGPDALPVQLAVLGGLADGTGRRGKQFGTVLAGLPEPFRSQAEWGVGLLKQAAATAADGRPDVAERVAAIRLLAHAPWAVAGPVLATLLTEGMDQGVKLAAVRALADQPGPEPAEALLKPWAGYTPAVRREAAEVLVRQPDRALRLLHAVEAGHIRPSDLDSAKARQLLQHPQPDIKALAAKLLRDNLPEERKQVLERYKRAARAEGDAARGKLVFQKNCATCHRVAGLGVDVGADISDTRGKAREALLNDILNPNAAIDSNFIEYTVTLKNGRTVSGIIATETAGSVTLKRAENQTDTVLRQDIGEMQSTGRSLMPEGLEKSVSVAEMADLLSFLKNWRYLDGTVPLGDKK